MARIDPLLREDLVEFEETFALVEQTMGFVPNSMLTMARVPGLLSAFGGLGRAVFGNGLIPRELIQMVAHVASSAAGCRYCQAHTAHTAQLIGVDEAKLADLWRFDDSPHFTPAERVALRLALHAGSVPNVASRADMEACSEHYSDDQIAAIVATISFFGYLNRWNDTIATDLEDAPAHFGRTVLADSGWVIDKHGG